MFSIVGLFKETKNHDYELEELLSLVPKMNPPKNGSKEYVNDVETVVFYFNNPSLNPGFLNISHDSVEEIYKKYCDEFNVDVNWKKLKPEIKKLKKVTKHLKKKHKRPRPKSYLCDMSNRYDSISEMDSYSFPSGHTSKAYFLATTLGNMFPEIRSDFENLAELIGLSRLENGVHYPTDITYGRLIGETLGDCLTPKKNKKRDKESNKEFAQHLRSLNVNPRITAKNIANFLYKTLQIEGFSNKITYNECFDAAKNLLTGLSDQNITSNSFILSQCKGLRQSYCKNKNYYADIMSIHKEFNNSDLEKGVPGEFRSHSHYSPAGIEYCDVEKLLAALNEIDKFNDPYVKHAIFEWVHPFCDGNGRSGRIKLCADTNYDFESVIDFMSKDYFETLNNFYCNNDLYDLLLN